MADEKQPDAEEEPKEAAAAEPEATEAVAEGSEEAAEKPKRRRATKAKADAESAEEAPETAAEQAEAPKKPRRSRAKKAETEAGAEAQESAETSAVEGEEPAAEEKAPAKPRRRSRAAAAETPEQPEPAPRRAPAPSAGGSVRVVRAQARYVRTSARKARLVCDHLRGKSVDEARAILAFNPRGVARDWSKVLESAIANAENNHELVAEDLVVREAFADEGPTIKRFQPRARGRASSIRKRTSHLTITLAPERR